MQKVKLCSPWQIKDYNSHGAQAIQRHVQNSCEEDDGETERQSKLLIKLSIPVRPVIHVESVWKQLNWILINLNNKWYNLKAHAL